MTEYITANIRLKKKSNETIKRFGASQTPPKTREAIIFNLVEKEAKRINKGENK